MSKQAFDLMKVRVYVSGTVNNDKSGGFSALMIAGSGDMQVRRTISGYGENTTITRMQLKAVESALISIKNRQEAKLLKNPSADIVKPILEFYTNNAQVSAGLNKHIFNWAKSDWKTKKGAILQHADLWESIYVMLDKYVMAHKVLLNKVDETNDDMLSTIRQSLLLADKTSSYALAKHVELNEESIINGNTSVTH